MMYLPNPMHVNVTLIQVMKIPESDDIDLLAILQALAIYAVILLFPKGSSTRTHEDDQGLILAFQDITLRVAASGLALSSELDGNQPTWNEWAYISAKRRTILMVYFLTWAWSEVHGYEPLHCAELVFMLAPAAKSLW
jgi:hypothetical protein